MSVFHRLVTLMKTKRSALLFGFDLDDIDTRTYMTIVLTRYGKPKPQKRAYL